MRNIIRTIGNYSLFAAVFTLAAMALLTVLDVFLSKAFLVFIPGVFSLSKVMLLMIVFFAAIHIVCLWLSRLRKGQQGGEGA